MIREKTMQQFCPQCDRIVTASYILEFSDTTWQLVSDKSVCSCGQVLWDWRWDARYRPPIEKVPKTDGRPKEQMRLF